MKCHLCNDRETAHSEQGTGLCNFCWELKSRIDAEPELAGRILTRSLIERGERSPLGPLRAEIIGFVGRLQAIEANEEGEEVLAWADVIVDGVRGLTACIDEELLHELSGILTSFQEFSGGPSDDADLGRSLERRLEGFPIWKKIIEEEHGELADEVGPDGGLAEG